LEADTGMTGSQWLTLKDRALAAAAEGITIADARASDRPLIYVNEGFERLTGYTAAEALGRNCKFLQGPQTDPDTIEEIRAALAAERDCTVEILNYRRDGEPFWNRLSITPVRDGDDVVTHYIGIQSDVTERRNAEDGLRAATRELAAANATMQRELAEAARIQRAWLPRRLPAVPGFRFAWTFTPCTELGGDSLHVIRLDRDHVGLYVLDVSGHGVGAALLSASIQRWLSAVPEHSRLFARTQDDPERYTFVPPAEVAADLNRRFYAEPESGKFFTLIYGVLDVRDGLFRYATAGHPPPLRARATGAESCPAATGLPIGVLEDFAYEETQIRLEAGDRLLLYTDGAVEATNATDDFYGAERLQAQLATHRQADPDTALAAILADIQAWGDTRGLEDDVTLLSIDATAD
jgi:PAS domain S-box-containing protein